EMKLQLELLAALLLLVGASQAQLQPEGRILGGAEATNDATPHAASLRVDNAHVCGASIISETKLLTTAHCLYRDNKLIESSRISVRVGSSNQYAGGHIFAIASYVIHPEYYKLDNNLAVLTLSEPLQWTDRIKAIELSGPEDALPAVGAAISIAGWGTTVEGTSSFKIRQLSLSFASAEVCLDAYADYDGSKVFCLAHALKEGSCNGDGGSAAVYQGKLLGISNFVVGACGSRYPDVFVLAAGYSDWLQQQLA
ncbi:hypothetical protein KR222_001967, partial [Zaprionus bogoriensis]